MDADLNPEQNPDTPASPTAHDGGATHDGGTMSPRDVALRALLTATVVATAGGKSTRRRSMIASVAAFGIAGALTGGAISAAALTAAGSGDDDAPLTAVDVEQLTRFAVRADTELFGVPVAIRSDGDTAIDFGPKPEGATSIAYSLDCIDPGTFTYRLDGETPGWSRCGEADLAGSNGGGFFEVASAGDHVLEVLAPEGQSFVIWASWAAPAMPSEPSADQQAALSDGIVSEEEYRAGFARYRACMADAGHSLVGVDESGPVITFSVTGEAVFRGDDQRCYASEFEQVDTEWQLSVPPATR